MYNIYINFVCHVQISKYMYKIIKNQDITKTIIYSRIIFRFLPNFQRLNK